MSANSVPRFMDLGIIGGAQALVANSNLDGTGTLVALITGSLNGTLITHVIMKAIVTTTAGMVRFFYDDTLNIRLIHEVVVAPITPAAGVAAWVSEWIPTGDLIIPNNKILKVAVENAEAINLHAIGGDY